MNVGRTGPINDCPPLEVVVSFAYAVKTLKISQTLTLLAIGSLGPIEAIYPSTFPLKMALKSKVLVNSFMLRLKEVIYHCMPFSVL